MNNFFHRANKQEAVALQRVVPDQSSSMRLKGLVANNQKMYFALQTFLLAGGEKQISQLGEASSLLARGHAYRAKGNYPAARINYQTAAKIEIYKQNKDSAINCLVRAEEVSKKELTHHEFQETMLADMDEVLRISKAYQSATPGAELRTI
jgi:hypothetical protein